MFTDFNAKTISLLDFDGVATAVKQVGSKDFHALRGSLASYAGHLQHGAAGHAWQRLWSDHAWLAACFRRQGPWGFVLRWPVAPVMVLLSFGARYRRLVATLGGRALVFCRVGRYVEFRGPGLLLAVSVLGLRRVVLPRGGYARPEAASEPSKAGRAGCRACSASCSVFHPFELAGLRGSE